MDMTRRDTIAGISVMASLAALPFCAAADESFGGISPVTENPILQTQHGSVEGYRPNEIAVFKGVRYCSDTRLNRFQKPLSPQPWQAILKATHSPHTIDIAHALNNPGAKGSFVGTDKASKRVASVRSQAFIALAHNGDPNHEQLPDWDIHTLPDRETMVFGQETSLKNDPRKAEREIFATNPFTQ